MSLRHVQVESTHSASQKNKFVKGGPIKDYTSFDRVAVALDHKEPDRVPLDFGGAEVASINIHAMRRLRRHLGMSEAVTLDDTVIQTGKMEDDLIDRLNVDVKIVKPNPPANSNLAEDLGLQDGCYRLIDEYGMGWAMPECGGKYYDLYHSPLANAETVSDVETFPWPDPLDAARFVGIKENARKIASEDKKAVFLGRASSGRKHNGNVGDSAGVWTILKSYTLKHPIVIFVA